MKTIDESFIRASEMMKALGHPVRIKILSLLGGKRILKMSVKQIQESLGLTQPQTSRHLIVMKNCSVLSQEKEGYNSYYFINDEYELIRCLAISINKCMESNPNK